MKKFFLITFFCSLVGFPQVSLLHSLAIWLVHLTVIFLQDKPWIKNSSHLICASVHLFFCPSKLRLFQSHSKVSLKVCPSHLNTDWNRVTGGLRMAIVDNIHVFDSKLRETKTAGMLPLALLSQLWDQLRSALPCKLQLALASKWVSVIYHCTRKVFSC